LFDDNVTLNIQIFWMDMGAGVLGSAGSFMQSHSDGDARSAMYTDAKSATDATATSHLQTGTAFDLLLNRTSDSPCGPGSATTYLDNDGSLNNTTISMTNANAKALGLLSGTHSALDAFITFNSNPLAEFDLDPLDVITPFYFDLLGVTALEIGHMLGFLGGVDVLDHHPGLDANDYPYVNTLDLVRYSTESAEEGAIDWTADAREKYFSIDGGTSALALFSTGPTFGDGYQASHWKDDFDESKGYDAHDGFDDFNIGLMDPTAPYGPVAPRITALDIQALDVMGWDLRNSEVPEPGSLALVAVALAALAAMRKRKQA
jgi:PEP-CTERM motif